ncbi:LysR family transcriptional regulator [Methylobacterium nonmethylotrophicum]|uniref:LysR family transcriptional regulator n=1 Tax=Methylobacterium nonmethylotrophicum TaxID=1141884 RepID=A0A4Z0NT34_9HYPH|nr:LysR family transcriptional regulator [Methylobacterium nonmethylotrophicum]TGE00578.1 LysR family transcriptional regulator [Methylobacterium nonmethylotrophicum]
MQLRALIYFNELARHGSMRRAAEKLGIAPTAISRQIENLEYHFGAPLVERDPTGIRLTAAGELLAARSARTLRELDHVRTLIDDLKGLRAGRVTVYASGAAASGLLVPALADFSASYPEVRFEVVVASVGRTMQALVEGEADLAVTLFTPPEAETFVRCRVAIDHAAVMAPSHPLARLDAIGPRDLLAHPVAMPDAAFGVRQALDGQMREAGLPPLDPVFTTGALEIQLELARRGRAVLVLPPFSVRRDGAAGTLVARPFRDLRIRTHLDLSHREDRPLSFAAAKLVGVLEQHMPGFRAPPGV